MKTQNRKKDCRGFTMAELLIVIVCVALLAAIAVPTINGVRDSLTDSAKVRNADKLNEYVCAIFNGGVDTSGYTDVTAVINELRNGVTIPSTLPGGTPIVIRLEKELNPAAYELIPNGANAPRFRALMGQRNVRP